MYTVSQNISASQGRRKKKNNSDFIGAKEVSNIYNSSSLDGFVDWVKNHHKSLSPKSREQCFGRLSSLAHKSQKANSCAIELALSEDYMDDVLHNASSHTFYSYLHQLSQLNLQESHKVLIQDKFCCAKAMSKLLSCPPEWTLTAIKALDCLEVKNLSYLIPWHKMGFLLEGMKGVQLSTSLYHLSRLGFTKTQLSVVLNRRNLDLMANQESHKWKMRTLFVLADLGFSPEAVAPMVTKKVFCDAMKIATVSEQVQLVDSMLRLGCDQDVISMITHPRFIIHPLNHCGIPDQIRLIRCLMLCGLEVHAINELLDDNFRQNVHMHGSLSDQLSLRAIDDELRARALNERPHPVPQVQAAPQVARPSWADTFDEEVEPGEDLVEKYGWSFVRA